MVKGCGIRWPKLTMSSKFDVPSNFDRRIGGVGISTVPLTTNNVLNEDDENLDVTDAKYAVSKNGQAEFKK
jgi:hypothetical protein